MRRFRKFDRMKNWMITGFVLATAFAFQSCDYVRNAAQSVTVRKPGDRKILVEDYTGHKCGNCPAAARELARLDSVYEGHIIPIAVHAGFYAQTNAQMPTDFRCQVGNDWDNTFGNSAAGNPNGLVNRKDKAGIKQWSEWNTLVAGYYLDSSKFNLSITNTYNSSTNQLTTRVRCKAMRLASGTFNLVVVLTEDSIIDKQIDYSVNPNLVPAYKFDHVLRGAINSSWGDPILTAGTFVKNDSVVKLYSNFQLSSSWKSRHCKVLAFVYDADSNSPTYYEVLQAESKEIQ